jgi:hypothetical protein
LLISVKLPAPNAEGIVSPELAVLVEYTYTPGAIVTDSAPEPGYPLAVAQVYKSKFVWFVDIVRDTEADLPCKLAIEIAPVGTAAKLLTLVWFNEIVVVEGMPSSVLTWLIDICPTGSAIMEFQKQLCHSRLLNCL